MRADEYLAFFGRPTVWRAAIARRADEACWSSFGMADGATAGWANTPKGMRQKLALVRALLHEPPVLLLDEPTSAMDPASAHQVRRQHPALRSEQRALIVCTHNLMEAESWPIGSPSSGRASGRPGTVQRAQADVSRGPP